MELPIRLSVSDVNRFSALLREYLVMDGNEIIGAVGVSGGTADEDELCAIAGIKAVGLEFKV